MRKILLASVALIGLSGAAFAQSNNQAYIDQVGGGFSSASQDQHNVIGSTARILQNGGSTNGATQYQTGQYHSAYIEQLGGYQNSATQEQRGSGNGATIKQDGGSGNLAGQKQDGTNLRANTTQNGGEGNRAYTSQTGTAHQSYITQDGGSGNLTQHAQSGNGGDSAYNVASSYMINQSGSTQLVTQDGTNLRATQNMLVAGSNNLQVINQTGYGNANVATQTVR